MDADVLLLDDPLSAVDARVGREIFESCILGLLKTKPVILVTHQLQFLKGATQILVLRDGEVEGLGSHEELTKAGIVLGDESSSTQLIEEPDVEEM
jgi:ATP-binding cassette subfamily C (CFTR/MRP) protein 4